MKRNLYVCRCESIEHFFVVSADEDFAYIEIHLAPLPWRKRILHVIRYLLGRRSKYGDFDEIILSPEDALDLGDRLVVWSSGEVTAFQPNDVH